MSKRFGRNQRRRLCQEIENLRLSDNMHRGLLVHQGKKMNELDQFVRDVIEIVGEMSAVNPNPAMQNGFSLSNTSSFQLPAYERLSINSFEDQRPLGLVKLTTMDVLETKVEDGVLSNAIHFHIRLGDDKVVYAISKSAVAMLPRRVLIERFHREISRQLATELVRIIKK